MYIWKKRRMLSLTLKKSTAAATTASLTAATAQTEVCAPAHFSDKCSFERRERARYCCIWGSTATFLFLHLESTANRCDSACIQLDGCECVCVCVCLWLDVFVFVYVTWYFDIVAVSIFLPFVLMPSHFSTQARWEFFGPYFFLQQQPMYYANIILLNDAYVCMYVRVCCMFLFFIRNLLFSFRFHL